MNWEQTVPWVSPYLENTSISTEVRGATAATLLPEEWGDPAQV